MVKLSVTAFSMDGSPSRFGHFLSGNAINQKKENVMLLHFSRFGVISGQSVGGNFAAAGHRSS